MNNLINIHDSDIQFVNTLTEALKQMYDKAYQIWDKIKNDDDYGKLRQSKFKMCRANFTH